MGFKYENGQHNEYMHMCILTSSLAVKLVLGVLTKCFHGKVFSVLISVTRGIVFSMNFIFISLDFVIEARVIGITFRGGKPFRSTVVISPV